MFGHDVWGNPCFFENQNLLERSQWIHVFRKWRNNNVLGNEGFFYISFTRTVA